MIYYLFLNIFIYVSIYTINYHFINYNIKSIQILLITHIFYNNDLKIILKSSIRQINNKDKKVSTYQLIIKIEE